MPTIDDFVNQRWEDAKQALRDIDPDYVRNLESEDRLEIQGLHYPKAFSVGSNSRHPLSKEWHHLLEACQELIIQTQLLRLSAVYLTSDANKNRHQHEAGKLADYHFRSWFILATTLAERMNRVISKTSQVYLAEGSSRNKVVKHFREHIKPFIEELKELRNGYLHPSRSETQEITKDGLWEGLVTLGITPTIFLNQFHYPSQAERVLSGKYDIFARRTDEILICLGNILHDLEKDLKANYELKYPIVCRG